jgi:hypothetical protein
VCSLILHSRQVATFVAVQAKRDYRGSRRYNECDKTNHAAEEGAGELLEQLQGYKRNEARRDDGEEQEPDDAAKDVRGVVAEDDQCS